MQIGLIGCGNMARALARGWGRPVLCADPIADRAQALAAESGGEALESNAEVARRAELVVLCHKPAQLREVAVEVAPHAAAVASILAVTPLPVLREAYPGKAVYRFMPSLPVEVRQGALVQATDQQELDGVPPTGGTGDRRLDDAVHGLFAELGTLVVLDDSLVDVYTLLIILYIVVQLLFAAGLRPPYSRTLDAVLSFLRDIVEPYLRIFRRLIPTFGAFDFSPILAILTLAIFNSIIVQGLIHG